MGDKFVYWFDKNECEGSSAMKEILGSKGANLAEMCNLNIPVPPGFTISTVACRMFYKEHNFLDTLKHEIELNIAKLESRMHQRLECSVSPLLVSVRSGSVQSMPGMLDTVLNIGINDNTVIALANLYDKRFAFDSYRRLIQMYASVVLKVDSDVFEVAIENKKSEYGVQMDSELPAEALSELVELYKEIVLNLARRPFPQSVREQIYGAIAAVFESWNSERAISYRRINNITDIVGTAVNVQVMVFGNLNENSATGVIFTRNPSSGEAIHFGEYIYKAQGEDIVSGYRTPLSIAQGDHELSIQHRMPDVYKELLDICNRLERHYRDMQDIEFTVQDRKLWILQTRAGKRTAQASIRIAVEMVEESLITKKEALMRIDTESLNSLLHPILDPNAHCEVISRGLPASPGAASGIVVFTSKETEEMAKCGHKVIMVRNETSPEDIRGMNSAVGILTVRGGMTSHAAVVARGMGRSCVCGANSISIDTQMQYFTTTSGVRIARGDFITIDGNTGRVMSGIVPTVPTGLDRYFLTVMEWADSFRKVGVRSNADTERDIQISEQFNGDGIGLCRTEHMFFLKDRIPVVQEMIVANSTAARQLALDRLSVMQEEDFYRIFMLQRGKPVTIRLLDPPLHEFLPKCDESINNLAHSVGLSVNDIKKRINELEEENPMLGHRGCRLAVSYPEIYVMQVRAILKAAQRVHDDTNVKVHPEIMVPLVMDPLELKYLRDLVRSVASQFNIEYSFGAMIELPRAALLAHELAKYVDFFSFGTNDLTQMTMGLSRDDSSSFMDSYVKSGILHDDPFSTIDVNGVGVLMEFAKTKTKDCNVKFGICGEHGGDPHSIEFCCKIGLDYVSCSPYRIPVAKLKVAQYAIVNEC